MKISIIIVSTILILSAFHTTSDAKKKHKKPKGQRPGNAGPRGPDRRVPKIRRQTTVTAPHSGQMIRLGGGTGCYVAGRLEVYRGGRWGLVCDDNWDITDANVACKQLGFKFGAKLAVGGAAYGSGSWTSKDILMDNVDCKGHEDSLQACTFSPTHNCEINEAASVHCWENRDCEDGWISGPTGCYTFPDRAVKNAKKAQDICSRVGGHIAHIETLEENNFLSNTLFQLFTVQYPERHVWLVGGRRRKKTWNWEKPKPKKKSKKRKGKPTPKRQTRKPPKNGPKSKPRNTPRNPRQIPEPKHGRGRASRIRRALVSSEIQFTNWFPGWVPTLFDKEPVISSGVFCMALTNRFRHPNGSTAAVDYFYWDAIQCRAKQKTINTICEKPRNETLATIGNSVIDCYEGNGESYRGNVSKTNLNTTCDTWSESEHTNANTHPNKGLGDHNYCRNPDNSDKPWCWVDSKNSQYGYCALRRCSYLTDQQPDSEAKECYDGEGTDYRGSISVTRIGTTCQKWTVSNSINPETHPEMGLGDHNFCRNPDSSSKPWCWVDAEKMKFGYCPVPKCGSAETTTRSALQIDNGSGTQNECPVGQFSCQHGLSLAAVSFNLQTCIPGDFQCDGEPDCADENDELNCDYKLPLFVKLDRTTSVATRIVSFRQTPLEMCARYCVETRDFVCRSFCYQRGQRECFLMAENSQTARDLLRPSHDYDFYELSSQLNNCDDMFRCRNEKCIENNLVCNEEDNCNDFSDEADDICGHHNSSEADVDVRLAGGDSEHAGRVEINYRGEWGVICDDQWDKNDADVICRMLGYEHGAKRAAVKSEFGSGNGVFLLDDMRCTGQEMNIVDCPKSHWKEHNCKSYQVAGVECNSGKGSACETGEYRCKKDNKCIPSELVCNGDTECIDGSDELDCVPRVSLVDGTSDNNGRVELTINGVTGTICDDEWDDDDATVVCRMLGYEYGGLAKTGLTYGEGKGMIWLDNAQCSGNENSLADCGTITWGKHNCDHSEDAGVFCLTEPPSEPRTTTLSSAASEVIVTLVGGEHPGEGRVEITMNGETGTICDDSWDNNEALVVCKMLGYNRGVTAALSDFGGGGQGRILMDELQCDGGEESLTDCPHRTDHDCSHSEDAAVRCFEDEPQAEQDLIRLVGGPVPNIGRVVINLDGIHGTVCDDGFGEEETTVVCKMLGYTNGVQLDVSQFPIGSDIGDILLDDVVCEGQEETILDCESSLLDDCSHIEDVAVKCFNVSSSSTVRTTRRPTTEAITSTTESSTVNTVRLIDGSGPHEGWLQVERDGVNGTVCDDGFEDVEASVVCRMLGYWMGIVVPNHYFGSGQGIIWLDDVNCQGDETSLFDCTSAGWENNNCGHAEDVGIICSIDGSRPTTTVAPMKFELVGGSSNDRGRVEIIRDGVRGTVCDDKWDVADARVICRMLGFVDGRSTTASSFGNGQGKIWLDNVECTGEESSISECQHAGWGQNDCTHSEDAGVYCFSTTLPVIDADDVRMSLRIDRNDSRSAIGRVILSSNGHTGSLCTYDDVWGIPEATFVCRMLRFTAGLPTRYESDKQEAYWSYKFDCAGTDANKCTYKEDPNMYYCESKQYAGVVCTKNVPPPQPPTSPPTAVTIELVGGDTQNEGRVEVILNGRRGTVCDDSWTDEDAAVVCKMIGYQRGGVAVTRAAYGPGDNSLPILFDDVMCRGTESSILDCPLSRQHNCEHTEDAGVFCTTDDGGDNNGDESEQIFPGHIRTATSEGMRWRTTTSIRHALVRVEPALARVYGGCGRRPIDALINARKKRDIDDLLPPKVLGERPVLEKITGGVNADYGKYPWQVGVRIKRFFGDEEGSHWCGGTVVNEYWVISAAHCFDGRQKSSFSLRFGDLDNKKHDQYEQEFDIETLIAHEDYDGTSYDYDIVLLKIKPKNSRGIRFNNYIQPACLPTSATGYTDGTVCLISGWGTTKLGAPDLLKKAEVPLLGQSRCKSLYGKAVTNRMLCAGVIEGGIDTCQGDSGGPLVCESDGNFTLFGVTSWGNGCGLPNSPGIYTHVRNVLPWIHDKLKRHGNQ